MKKYCILLLLLSLFSCSKDKKEEKASLEMQNFIINISKYARGIDSDFIIIPQNGIELAFNNTDQESGLKTDYVNAINGVGVEELFYDGTLAEDDGRLSMFQTVKQQLTVMVADYVSDNSYIADDIQKCKAEGFICFPRATTNYDYVEIPDTAMFGNTNDIDSLSKAKNYLYLINSEKYSSKQSFIDAVDSSDFDLIIIDLYFNDEILTSDDLAKLKTKPCGARRLLISYINIGAAENWRYYWEEKWKVHRPNWLKKKYEGYEDEIWVKFWEQDWQDIIYGNDNSYMKKIIDAGFDGAYLDNIEAYYFLYED